MDTGKKVGPDELLERVPEMAQVAEIVPVPFQSVGSTAIGPAEWLLLTETIHDVTAREAPLDGVVITHGTATLEETAYFLNLAVRDDVTVVVVGAQRPASGLSSDAGMNLVSAVRVAAAPEARGLGVLVVLNDEIQAAREVTKASTLRLETFRSAISACWATLTPTAASPSTAGRRGAMPRIPSSTCAAGGPAARRHRVLLCRRRRHRHRCLRRRRRAGDRHGVDGARRDDRRGDRSPAPCAQAGRAGRAVEPGGSGRVLPRTTLRERGFVVADNLLPQKARILAMLALTRTDDPVEVQRCSTRTDVHGIDSASIGALRRREPPRGSSPARRRAGRDAAARCPGRADVRGARAGAAPARTDGGPARQGADDRAHRSGVSQPAAGAHRRSARLPARALRRRRASWSGGSGRALIARRRHGRTTCPSLVVPPIIARLRHETQSVDPARRGGGAPPLPGERRGDGTRLNLNQLGEAILGEAEAARRLEAYLALLARDDVEYISVKVSSVFSQINLVAFRDTVERIKERLRALYRQARAPPLPPSRRPPHARSSSTSTWRSTATSTSPSPRSARCSTSRSSCALERRHGAAGLPARRRTACSGS